MCKKLVCLTSLILMLGLVGYVSAVEVTVDDSVRYQTIEGWGACAGMEILTTDTRAKEAYKNLGCNLLRIAFEPWMFVAPGGDLEGPEVPLTGDLPTDAAKFNFEHERTDHWDDVAVWLVNNALEPDRVKLVASPWSVPHWAKAPTGAVISYRQWRGPTPIIMYYGNDTAGGTWDTGIYQQDRYPYCANFMSAACYGFEQHAGVTLYALSMQNEVAFENPFNSCTLYHQAKAQKVESETIMDYNVYANALKAVKDEWAAQPDVQHIKIMGPHHAGLDEIPENPWGHLFQMEGIAAVKNHSDQTLIDFLDIYTHNYGAPAAKRAEMFRAYWEGITSMPDELWAEWAYSGPGIMNDGKQTWNSEFGGHSPDWNGALDLASDVHTQMVWGNESAIIHWAFCEDSFTIHNLLSVGQLDNPYTNPKYSTFKQFSRYVHPGAERVSATFADGSTTTGTGDPMDTEAGLSASAYVHDGDGRATIVLVNMLASDQTVTINVPSSPAVTTYQVFLSQSGAAEGFVQQSDLVVSGGQVSLTVPASSVVTLTGTAAGPQPPGKASNPSPADGAGNVSVNADLTWTAGSGADSHDVYFGTTTSPSFATNQTETTYDPGVMANNTTYYWRIDEINAYGTTTGTLWSFTTQSEGTPPGQATNPSPADGATEVATNADLIWTAGSGADSHDVYFGTTTTPLFADNQTETTFEPGTMAENTTYFWRIDEVNWYGTTTGVLWNFTTVGAGCTPSTMHVDSITVTAPMTAPPNSIGRAEVVIVDNCGDPVSGALVSGTFTGDINESGSDTTDDNGLAVIETVGTAKRPSSLTFCVDSVTDTLTYNAGDNVETCDSL